jgi:hypothetical protein
MGGLRDRLAAVMSRPAPSLFDDDRPHESTGLRLIVVPQPGRPLTRQQRAFNRLVRKVERLRRELEQAKRELEADLVFHAQHVAPRLKRLAAGRRALVRAVRPFLRDTRLKPADRRTLEGIVADHLSEIAIGTEPGDDDLEVIFAEIHGEDYAKVAEAELTAAKDEMEAALSEIGLELDLSRLRIDMAEEEVAAAAAELFEDIERQRTAARAGVGAETSETNQNRRAAARARLRDEARRNSVGAVYRRLVKTLHPDLEPDEVARQRKNLLMQEVTAAHAANDLHALLRIEMEQTAGEQADVARLTDQKLRDYNQMLQEQADELELVLLDLPDHPRYEPLFVAGGPYGPGLRKDIRAEVAALDAVLESIEGAAVRLTGPEGLEEVRGAIGFLRGQKRAQARRGRRVRGMGRP